MTIKTVQKGSVGVEITATIIRKSTGAAFPLDDPEATVTLIIKKPSKKKVTRTPTFPYGGSDGFIRYLTVADDLDENGLHLAQAHVVTPETEFRTTIGKFMVGDNL